MHQTVFGRNIFEIVRNLCDFLVIATADFESRLTECQIGCMHDSAYTPKAP